MVVRCDKVAAPTGSDTNPGTLAQPYLTAQKLADSLSAGQTGCLRAGTYVQNVTVGRGGAAGSPLTVRNYPGENATLRGRLWVRDEANFVTITGLSLDGRNASNLPSPTVNGDDVTFSRNDLTNYNTGICMVLGASAADNDPIWGRALRTQVVKNKIHNCGALPATNHHHGVYVEAADDVNVSDNWIYDNADRGVQFYPDAQRAVVSRNVIDGNGEGVSFGGSDTVASSGNQVKNNVITFSNVRHNVESWWPGPIGTGNAVDTNCAFGSVRDDYGNGGIDASEGGFTAANNINADPLYVNRGGKDFRLTAASPCRGVLGAAADATPGPDTTPPDTTITSGPTGTTSSASASFSFSSEPNATFECRLDAGSWGGCSSPKSYSGLANGTHTFEVRASDESGNVDPTPASRTWTVSTTYRDRVLATSGLVSYWRLGEAAGATTAADAKGTNPGTYQNGVVLGRPGLITGDTNTAADFDGVNDQVLVRDAASLDMTSRISIEAWVKIDALPPAGQVKTLVTKSSSSYELTLYDSNGRGSLALRLNGTLYSLVVPAGTFAAGGRYHVVGTYDGAATRLYVNGTQVASAARSGSIAVSTADLVIGSSWGTDSVDAILDEVAVYNAALPATTVQDHYNAGR